MAREVPRYHTANLPHRLEVVIRDHTGITSQRINEMFRWLSQPERPGVFSYRVATSFSHHPDAVYFFIEDDNVAFEFKMRFA